MAQIKNILSKLKLFDVSLRDGLQSIPKIYELPEKKRMLSKIIHQYRPHQMEIGSIVSYSVLPQMKNSIELYKYATDKYLSNKNDIKNDDIHELDDTIKCDFFLLVPPVKSYINQASINNIHNISLITSVSETFQQKNIKRTINDTKHTLNNILCDNAQFKNIKLYISCITNCPFDGKRDNDYIINEIIYYSKIKGINNLCLSDTCGNIKFNDFKYIIDNLLLNINVDILSLHLHVNKENYLEIDQIIRYSINNKLYKFDVSGFENMGGCAVTMNQDKLHGNLHYKDLIDTMQKYTIVP
jgi:hydroxymethylglutaryl-CoA lyase